MVLRRRFIDIPRSEESQSITKNRRNSLFSVSTFDAPLRSRDLNKDDVFPLMDAYVKHIDNKLKVLGEKWVEISDERSVIILTENMHKDMAYGSKLMGAKEAEWFAKWFVKQFEGSECRYFCNGNARGSRNSFWDLNGNKVDGFEDGITDATFSSGVLIISLDKIGLLWFSDED